MVQTTDGSHVEVIPGQSFSPEDWGRLPQAEKARIIEERAQYKRNKDNVGDNSTTISEYIIHDKEHRITNKESRLQNNA